MQSPIYWHPAFYRMAMKLSYGKEYHLRYERLAAYIPEGANVFEVCMGDAYFYQNYLRKKNVKYACCDINPVFVRRAKKLGVKSSLVNLFTDKIPMTDYVLMHASLSYFIPQEASIVLKLLSATRKRLIIAESIENLSNSSSGMKSAIGTFLSKAKAGQSKVKFTAESLRNSFSVFNDHIEVWDEKPGQRETIIVLKP